ncbi:hypothetical protein L1887_09254 [Cichorium endivia]|nr:hypothetical protein L1887_09254 [Cichorium endivia]
MITFGTSRLDRCCHLFLAVFLTIVKNPNIPQLQLGKSWPSWPTLCILLWLGLCKEICNGAMVVPAQLTAEAVNQLREGIDLLLGRWSALQMAIQNEWGGRDTRQKAQQLAVISITG